MSILGGTIRQKALFVALLSIYAVAFIISAEDKSTRVGEPDVGWLVDDRNLISPSRPDASELGLRGGGFGLAVNGQELDPVDFERRSMELVHKELGANNTVRFERRGQVYELEIPVRAWTWEDALFTHGAIDFLALLFLATAITSFALRPYEATSWAILALSSVSGSLLTLSLIPLSSEGPFDAVYLRCLLGFAPAVMLHAALAFPVIHPLLLRRSPVLPALYGLGAINSVLQIASSRRMWAGDFPYLGVLEAALLLAAILFFAARSGVLAMRSPDPLVVQRARILLVAAVVGGAPVSIAAFLRNTVGIGFDIRYAYWGLSLFFLPLGYISVRQSLVNAQAAVRRAVIYAGVAGVLTAIAMLLIAVQAYAIALLLFPLLYWWPRFDQRLTARIYPKRTRFPMLLQELGAVLASQSTAGDLLDVLARAPERLVEARSAVAFLLPGIAGPREEVRSTSDAPNTEIDFASETLVKLMETTKKEIFRAQVAVEPQYSNIEADCYAGFDRLDADVLLPILRDGQVIGGLAVGSRATGEVYEPPEVFALSTVAQQGAQALARVEAVQRLKARENEFSELKRFFPPQVIDQVMEKGGAAELRTRRKRVTVFFADLRGFTAFSEGAEPEEVMTTLAEYHDAMGRRIAEFGGTLERFAGDGFMVFFNDPVDQPDHVERAAEMALAMGEDGARLRESWKSRGYEIDVGMGIHTGYATVGFVGYEGRRDYAVVGTVTNLAARLSDAAQGGEILVTGSLRSELASQHRTEEAGELELKGFQKAQAAYRLLPRD